MAVFCKRLDGFTLRLKDLPKELAGDSVRIEAAPDLPGLDAKNLRLFYRFKDGEWQGGEPGGFALVKFPAAGTYAVEFVGMDPQGGASKPVSLTLNSRAHKAGG
jgi:hypothetical protein